MIVHLVFGVVWLAFGAFLIVGRDRIVARHLARGMTRTHPAMLWVVLGSTFVAARDPRGHRRVRLTPVADGAVMVSDVAGQLELEAVGDHQVAAELAPRAHPALACCVRWSAMRNTIAIVGACW